MAYPSIMVHLDIEQPNSARLQAAGDLAERFESHVIGIAACYSQAPAYYAEGAFAQGLIEQDRREIKERLRQVESEFSGALKGRGRSMEWRGALTAPTEYVAREARAADIVITGPSRGQSVLDPARCLDPSALILRLGRPALFVGANVDHLRLRNILVCWKDSREARRAVLDAIPLLRQASDIIIAGIIEDDTMVKVERARLDDIVSWVGKHGVSARSRVESGKGPAAEQIDNLAEQLDADIVVAGAYGHTRLSELVFGGVTRSLLAQSPRSLLLSH